MEKVNMKKTIFIICNILVLFFLTSCFGSIDKEELKLAENAEKEAIPLIHDHFKSKYGIEVEVKSVLASFSGCSHDSDRCFDGVVNAAVIYNGSTFPVKVYNQLVHDNFQAAEIRQSCLTYALEKLDLPQPVHYEISPQYALQVNDYFDGTNTEKFFDMIAPSFILIYDNDTVFDNNLPKKLNALFQNTTDSKLFIQLIVLEKDSADKIPHVSWNEYTVWDYAPYVEYSVTYKKNQGMEPNLLRYLMEPLSDDLPILKEFLVLKTKYNTNNFVIRQEEHPQGWNIERGFEQIMPSYRLLWDEEERDSRRIFIPPSVWMDLCEKYDEIYLLTYEEYASGKNEYMKHEMNPDRTEYSQLSLHGEFFCFKVDTSTAYITFSGKSK